MSQAKRYTLIWIVALFFALAFIQAVDSQDLLRTNPNYIKARDLQLKSEQALNNGEYDKAYEYAEESKRLSALALAEAEARLLALRANSWRYRAGRRIEYAKAVDAEKSYPDEWKRASELYEKALEAYNAQEYEEAIEGFRAVVSILEVVKPGK
jgi:outer membrane protein assembly factor BamD (BamD/ComL family)